MRRREKHLFSDGVWSGSVAYASHLCLCLCVCVSVCVCDVCVCGWVDERTRNG